MRIAIPAGMFLVAATLNVAFCQTPPPNNGPIFNDGIRKNEPRQVFTARQVVTEKIRRLISSPTPLTELSTPPLLHRMGDAAAAVIAEILKTRGPLSKTEQQNVAQILHKAFEHPRSINILSNQTTPRETLALLDQLIAGTTDVDFKQALGDTRQFVIDASAWHW